MSTDKIKDRGQDINAYTRILKYRNKRYGVSLKDGYLLFITLVIVVAIFLSINAKVVTTYSTAIFIINLIYIIFLIFAFIDYAAGLGLFKGIGVITSSIVLLTSIIIATTITFIADKIFIPETNVETQSLIFLVNLIFVSVIISYFVMTSTPNRQGSEEIIKNLTEIKSEVTKLSVSELGIKEALKRSTKWLQFQQAEERIWGDNEPLFETAEILRGFLENGRTLAYAWKDVKLGEESMHKLEQTYYLLIDNLEKVSIQPELPILSALLTIGTINPENLKFESDKDESTEKLLYLNSLKLLYEEFEEELNLQSEWDFVSQLEKLKEGFDELLELPKIFYFARLYHVMDNKKVFHKCVEIISETFGILINRSDSRFNFIEQNEISNFILGLMYNTLNVLLRSPVIYGDDIDDIIETLDEKEDDGAELSGISLPGFGDFDFDDDDMDIDDILDDQSKLTINVSLAKVRNLIRKKQDIDGSWSARIDSTAECLKAVLDRESAEADYIKIAVHYLLALQDKDGSWQGDVLLTSRVSKALYSVQNSIGGI